MSDKMPAKKQPCRTRQSNIWMGSVVILIILMGGLFFARYDRVLRQLKDEQKAVMQVVTQQKAQHQHTIAVLEKRLREQSNPRTILDTVRRYGLWLQIRDLVQHAENNARYTHTFKQAADDLMQAETLLNRLDNVEAILHSNLRDVLASLLDRQSDGDAQILLKLSTLQAQFDRIVQAGASQTHTPVLSTRFEQTMEVDTSFSWWQRMFAYLRACSVRFIQQFKQAWVITALPESQNIQQYPTIWQTHGHLYFDQAIFAVLHHHPALYAKSLRTLDAKLKISLRFYPELKALQPALFVLQQVSLKKRAPDFAPLQKQIDRHLQTALRNRPPKSLRAKNEPKGGSKSLSTPIT